MKKFLLSLVLLSTMISPLFGQATIGFHRYATALSRAQSGVNAQIVPNARVTVTSTATGTAATIYSDAALSSQITPSVVTADTSGNYGYYIPLDYCVTETITSPGQGSVVIPNICNNNNGGSGVIVQTNSVNNSSQAILNHVDTTTIKFTNPSGGTESANCANATSSSTGCVQPDNTTITVSGGVLSAAAVGNQLNMRVNPPAAGTYITVYPSGFTATSSGTEYSSSGSKTSAKVLADGCTLGGCAGAGSAQVIWTYTLPGYVNPANVTAVWASSSAAAYPSGNNNGSGAVGVIHCDSGVNSYGLFPTSANAYGPYYTMQQFNAHMTAATGSSVNSITCTAAVGNGSVVQAGLGINVSSIYLQLADSVDTAPAANTIQVAPPLYFNQATQILGLYFPPDLQTDTGAANAYVIANSNLTMTPGTTIKFIPTHSSTSTTPTLALNGVPATTIVGPTGGALTSGDLLTTAVASILLGPDGKWWLQNPQTAAASSTINVNGSAVSNPNFNGTTPAAGANGKNIAFQVSSSSVSGELVGDGNAAHYFDGTGNFSTPAGAGAFAGGLGASYQDVTEIAAPANPSAGVDRLYTNSSTHLLACLTSSGGNCMPSAGGGGSPGGSSGDFQFNNAGSFGGGTGLTYGGSAGQVTDSITEAVTGVTNKFYGVFNMNALDLNATYNFNQTAGVTSPLTAGLSVGSGGTMHQANALTAMANNSSTSTNVVGGYFTSACLVSGSSCWGDNPLVSSVNSSPSILIGSEVDVNVHNTGDTIRGIYVNGAWTAQPSTLANGVEVDRTGGTTGQWINAFVSANGRVSGAAYLVGRSAISGSSASQPITFQYNNGSNQSANLNADSSGNLKYGSITMGQLGGGGLGSAPYQSAANVTSFISGPTTTGHLFLYGWTPSGSALAPIAFDFGANAATWLKATSPLVATQNANDVTFSCPTCGTGSGGTSVSQNSGSAETNLSITGFMPQTCSDFSASQTAKVCSTANTFTPQANNCVVFTSTTSNSGAGLTLNVNSLGAKSVAIPGSSGWTTTLTASIIPASKPLNACYDGTNWNIQQTGVLAAGSTPNTTTWVVDPLVSNINTGSPAGIFGLQAKVQGAASVGLANPSTTGLAGKQGVWNISGGTGTNSFSTIAPWAGSAAAFTMNLTSSSGTFKIAGYAYDVASSAETDVFGWANQSSSPNPTREIDFHCDPNQNAGSTHWFAFISSTINVDTGVSCSNVWHQLEIVASNLSITFYIDGTSVATGTATTDNYMPFASSWNHNSGTTPNLYLDWIAIPQDTIPSTLQ